MTARSGPDPQVTAPPLRLLDAVGSGLAALLGAGLFVVFAPAAAAAGDHLLIAVAAAALVAVLNARSSVRLAASHRSPLGTHVHARDQLGTPWGHLAGWAFVVGATSACAALALTIGLHLFPDADKVVAVVAVLAALGLCLQGIQRSARAAQIVALLVVLVVLTFVVVLFVTPPVLADAPPSIPEGAGGVIGVVQAAGFLVFALAGHLHVVNLRGAVEQPQQTIPRAIALSLATVIVLLAVLSVGLSRTLGVGWIAAREAPLAEAAEISAWPWLGPVLRVAAVLASGGVLMWLLPAAAATVAAMARDRHLPTALAARVGPHLVPRPAQSVVAAFVVIAVVLVDVRQAMALTSFALLVHFALVHASVWRLDPGTGSRALAATGLIACLVVALLLPWPIVLAGSVILFLGSLVGWVRHTTRE